jgi:hypothetical protein
MTPDVTLTGQAGDAANGDRHRPGSPTHGEAPTGGAATVDTPVGVQCHPLGTGRGWAYTGVTLGGVVSVAANVAHSYVPPANAAAGWVPHTGAVVGAVFWPVALVVAIEILARVPWPDLARWAVVRFGGLIPVAAVAAVVSYRHMSGLLAFYGEDTVTSVIGPLAVDGLMVMATGALLATRRTRVRPVAVSDGPADVTAPVVGASGDTTPDTAPDTAPRPVTPGPKPPRPKVTPRRPDTRTAVARLRAQNPDLTQHAIAAELGVSRSAVAAHWPTTQPDTALHVA